MISKYSKSFYSYFIKKFIKIILLFLIIPTLFIIYNIYIKYISNKIILYNINNLIKENTVIYDMYGNILNELYLENRISVSYEDIPDIIVSILLFKEDIRFKKHVGVDARSVFRAIYFGGMKGGGSTITQQLSKILFTTNNNNINYNFRIIQKLIESIIAYKLENIFSKQDILVMYLNSFDFLYNARGIGKASNIYFNKNINKLNFKELLILIGMLENPYLYNPINKISNSIKQSNTILNIMRKHKFINDVDYFIISHLFPRIQLNLCNYNYDYSNNYYIINLKKEVNNLINIKKININNISTSGIRIFTTLNKKLQLFSKISVNKYSYLIQDIFDKSQKFNIHKPFWKNTNIINNSINNYEREYISLFNYLNKKNINNNKFYIINNHISNNNYYYYIKELYFYRYNLYQVGFISVNTKNGNIKAWIGGNNNIINKFDTVKQMKRQIGSVFKPIIFITAIKEFDLKINTLISNKRYIYGHWKPKNHNNVYGGLITLQDALAHSVNIVAIRLGIKSGIDNIIDFCHNIGITSKLNNDLSLSLGSSNISLYEIVSAYRIFINSNRYTPLYILNKLYIKDKIYNFNRKNNEKSKFVINKKISLIMKNLLHSVVKYGTAKSIKKYNINIDNIYGKTGTTNNNSDSWFIGITPKLTTGIWGGWINKNSHFINNKLGQGAYLALPIWALYYKNLIH